MRNFAVSLVALAAIAFAGTASAGEMYFSAYKDGKQAELRDPKSKKMVAGKQIRVYTQAEYDKLTENKKKDNTETATMCGAKYFLSKKDADWKKAHEDAKHEIRVRDHVAKGKYEVVCPKEAAMPPKEPPKKDDKKKSS
jgi:hypothetical protein